jgi:chromosome segregation ATPase
MQRIKTLEEKLAQLRANFGEVATGIALEQAMGQKAEVRRLTARPRELSQLRTQIERDQEQLQVARRALENLDQPTQHACQHARAEGILGASWLLRQL